MGDNGVMFVWGTPVRGRERKGLEVFLEAQEVWGKAQANGEIESFETVLCQPSNGGAPGGYMVAWGSDDQIDAFVRSEEFQRMQMRAGMIVDGVGITRCVRGEALMEGMGAYGQAIDDLG